MKKIIAIVLVVLAGIHFSFGQVSSGVDAQENLNQLGGSGNVVRTMKPLKIDAKGSPILFDEPKQALPFKDGKNLGPANFNFHIGERKLLIQTKSGVNFMEELNIDSLVFQDPKRVFVNGNLISPSLEKVPYEIVHLNDGGKLYIEHEVQMIPASYQGAYSIGANYDEYIKQMSFYVLENGTLSAIKFNRSWFKQNYAFNKQLIELVNKKLLKFNNYENQLEILAFVSTPN